MSVLRRSGELVDLVDRSRLHLNGPPPEPHPEQTSSRSRSHSHSHSRRGGRRLQSRYSSSQPSSSSRGVEQRDTNKPNATHNQKAASQEAAVRSPRRVKNDFDKPLPPPPTTVITSSALGRTFNAPRSAPTPTLAPTANPTTKPTLRSRFNTGPASSQAPEIEDPRVVFVPQNAAEPDLSITAVLSPPAPPQEKSTHYRPATGDLWPFMDLGGPSSRRHKRQSSGEVKDQQQQQQQQEEEEDLARRIWEKQKELIKDPAEDAFEEKERDQEEAGAGAGAGAEAEAEAEAGAEKGGPSDYELFVQQAREKDRHFREQLLRIFSRRGARDGSGGGGGCGSRTGSPQKKEAKQRDPDHPRVFSWQRAAANRQQQEEEEEEGGGGGSGGGGGVRRSWGAGEPVQSQQDPSARKRYSDFGPSNSSRGGGGGNGGGLKRKESKSSMSSIRKALANYIKPPKSPDAH